MPLQLITLDSPALFPQIADIRRAAFHSNSLQEVIFPISNHERMNAFYLAREKIDAKNPQLRAFGVLDTVSNRLAAWMRWSEPRTGDSNQTSDAENAGPGYPEGTNVELKNEFDEEVERMEQKYMDQSSDWELLTLVVHPDYQGRGCAGMLMKRLISAVDEAGVKSFIAATAVAKPLYEKFGFKEVDTVVTDLEKYSGRRETHVMSAMIREPLQ